jgi:hypothetical protein
MAFPLHSVASRPRFGGKVLQLYKGQLTGSAGQVPAGWHGTSRVLGREHFYVTITTSSFPGRMIISSSSIHFYNTEGNCSIMVVRETSS